MNLKHTVLLKSIIICLKDDGLDNRNSYLAEDREAIERISDAILGYGNEYWRNRVVECFNCLHCPLTDLEKEESRERYYSYKIQYYQDNMKATRIPRWRRL
jgi:hypothetical protein